MVRILKIILNSPKLKLKIAFFLPKETREALLTQQFAKKLKEKVKKLNTGRLPRRKYVPRNPNLHTNLVNNHEGSFQGSIADGENARLPEMIVPPTQNPLNSLMAQISTLDQSPMVHNPPVQIKNEISDTPPPIECNSMSPSIARQEEITVTPDVNFLSADINTPHDNQIALKKVRATSFPCPLCPMEATQGHIRFHLHSVHGCLLRDFDKLHRCLICSNPIKSKDILSHSLTHDFDMAFDCTYCDERFFYKIRLDQHLEKVHQTYTCDFCEMTFYSRKDWKSHITTKVHKMKKFAKEEFSKRGINI